MVIYYTETSDSADYSYLEQSTLTTSSPKRGIFGFDIQDEQVRREPWSANQETAYNFIKEFVTGLDNSEKQRFHSSRMAVTSNQSGKNNYGTDDDGPYYTVNFEFNNHTIGKGEGLIGKQDYLFVERYGEYNYENVAYNEGEDDYNIISNITESVDILDNNEIVPNNKGTIKRVIQYIYIASYA